MTNSLYANIKTNANNMKITIIGAMTIEVKAKEEDEEKENNRNNRIIITIIKLVRTLVTTYKL